MILNQPAIDNGKEFEWGNISEDYARFRDIYPPEFYSRKSKKDFAPGDRRFLISVREQEFFHLICISTAGISLELTLTIIR